MTDGASSGEAGGTSDSVTPTAQVTCPSRPLQSGEVAIEKDAQVLEVPGSDAIAETGQPEITKTTKTTDDLLVSEKAPNPEHPFRAFVKKTGGTYQDYIDWVAEDTSSKEIYDMWVAKLGKYAESYDKSPESERAPRLARSFVDYVRTVDNRLEKIESKIGINAKSKKEPEDTAGKGHSVQTKFYNASAQPQSQSTSMDDDDEIGWNDRGTFISEVDPKHCLRVLFNWIQDHNTEDDSERDDEHPDPKHIEISDLRIHSDPITAFLAKQLDYDVQKNGVVHMKRPFRVLIRKSDAIKKQLSFLEHEYGLVYPEFVS